MDRPPPDPAKLLQTWMEWERGELPPGRVMANLKTGGLRDLLEEWAAMTPVASATVGSATVGSATVGSATVGSATVGSATDDSESSSAADTWKPVV